MAEVIGGALEKGREPLMIEGAKRYADTFTWKRAAEEVVDVYQNVWGSWSRVEFFCWSFRVGENGF